MSVLDDDWAGATLIPYAQPKDAFSAGEFMGLMRAVEALEALPKPQRETPGIGLALATINAMAMIARGNEAIRTMRFAAKKGYDINTHLVASGPEGVLCKAMDLVEQSA